MASSAVRDSLTCSTCREIYKDPVTLLCGHSFCQDCIKQTWDHQEEREYSCPECRRRFPNRPELKRNTRLRDLAEVCLAEDKKARILCTYCIDSPTPAVKSCLRCESSFCDKHLMIHSKSPGHVLSEPTNDQQNRKCSIHKETLEYYCNEDSACICESCRPLKQHRGHTVQPLAQACKKKKVKCRRVLLELTTRRNKMEKRIQGLKKRNGEAQEKASDIADRIAFLFRTSRKQMEDLERRVQSEISNKKVQISSSVSSLLRQLEIKHEELSNKIHHLEDLCSMTDPLSVIWESVRGDLCGNDKEGKNEDGARDDEDTYEAGDLDEILISLNIRKELADIVSNAMKLLLQLEDSDVYLDDNSAAANVELSADLKLARGVEADETSEKTSEEFESHQVLSSTDFDKGKHYWEVDIEGGNNFRIGMCYPSIDREGLSSVIGNSDDSWCLVRSNRTFSFKHLNNDIILPHASSIKRLGIYLDYEAGRLAFYELCDPIRHLHTFTSTFTEPLHAAFRVGLNVWVRIRT